MAEYKAGQKVLIKTSYRGEDDKFILAGRPGVIAAKEGSPYWPDYQIEVQMPDGPCIMKMRQSRHQTNGFLLDTPQNRKRYPVPDWNQIDLRELHWPKLMRPAGIRVQSDAFNGFIGKIAEACGGIETEGDIESIGYRWGNLSDKVAKYIFPSAARAKAFWELLRWIDWHGRTNYKAGVETGQDLLMQMARGELTPDMFEQKVHDKTRMESYHSHVW